jgi:hypothetical protein
MLPITNMREWYNLSPCPSCGACRTVGNLDTDTWGTCEPCGIRWDISNGYGPTEEVLEAEGSPRTERQEKLSKFRIVGVNYEGTPGQSAPVFRPVSIERG